MISHIDVQQTKLEIHSALSNVGCRVNPRLSDSLSVSNCTCQLALHLERATDQPPLEKQEVL